MIFNRYVLRPTTTPPWAFNSAAASSAPFAIVRPMYGLRENGASTAIVSVPPLVGLSEPPQPARAATAIAAMTAARAITTIAAQGTRLAHRGAPRSRRA